MTDATTGPTVFVVHEHEAELGALASSAASPGDGDELLEVARDAAALVAAIAAMPGGDEPSDADEWGAVEADGQLTVLGPDFMLLASTGSGELSITSGDVRWSVVPVDGEGRPLPADAGGGDAGATLRQAGRRVLRSAASKVGLGALGNLLDGPLRVTVSDAGTLVADSTFGAAGVVDNTDFDTDTAALEDEVGEILATGVQDEVATFEESQASAEAGGGDAGAAAPGSPDGGGPGGAAAVAGVVAAAGTVAARGAIRRAQRRGPRLRADQAEGTEAPPAAPAEPPVLWWFSVDEAVWARSAAGSDVAQLVPGTWYPAHQESGGWVETTAGGATGWIPAWAARRAPSQ